MVANTSTFLSEPVISNCSSSASLLSQPTIINLVFEIILLIIAIIVSSISGYRIVTRRPRSRRPVDIDIELKSQYE